MRVPLLLVLVLLAPSALAQGLPQNPACGPIDIGAIAVPASTTAGQAATLTVPVSNAGQVPATVTVTAQTSTPGWTLGTAPSPATVGAGATSQFAFTITPTNDAGGEAIVSFSASGTCDSPLGQACGAACNAGSANENAVVPYAPPEGFSIPGLDDLSIAPEYLIAGILLVLIAAALPFLLRGRRGGITAACPEPLKMVKPGRGTSFPIELRNAGKEAGVAMIDVSPVPEGWSVIVPVPEVQLAARETRSMWVMVKSPSDAASGDAVDVELRLRDPRGKAGGAVRVRAEVNGAADA